MKRGDLSQNLSKVNFSKFFTFVLSKLKKFKCESKQ